MKLNIKKAVFAALAGLLLLPLAAFAAVDYTAQDTAALTMTAQTDLPQAGDQYCKAYRQLLVFDHDTYGANYNYNNLRTYNYHNNHYFRAHNYNNHYNLRAYNHNHYKYSSSSNY